MVDPNVIRNAQLFLSRVDLKGAEVGAFVEVANWLADVQRQLEKLNSPAATDKDDGK